MKILIDLIPLLSVIINAFVSYFVSKTSAKNEIKKLLLTFEHENTRILIASFANLMISTDKYCNFNCQDDKNDAIKANSEFLTIAPSELKNLLVQLNNALIDEDIKEIKLLRKKLFNEYSRYIKKTN